MIRALQFISMILIFPVMMGAFVIGRSVAKDNSTFICHEKIEEMFTVNATNEDTITKLRGINKKLETALDKDMKTLAECATVSKFKSYYGTDGWKTMALDAGWLSGEDVQINLQTYYAMGRKACCSELTGDVSE